MCFVLKQVIKNVSVVKIIKCETITVNFKLICKDSNVTCNKACSTKTWFSLTVSSLLTWGRWTALGKSSRAAGDLVPAPCSSAFTWDRMTCTVEKHLVPQRADWVVQRDQFSPEWCRSSLQFPFKFSRIFFLEKLPIILKMRLNFYYGSTLSKNHID